MSIKRNMEITCPRCNHKYTVVAWQSLNSSLDPKGKQELLEGTLFTAKCPQCGQSSQLEYTILFNDPENELMVYCVSSQKEEREAKQAFQAMPISGVKRVVTSPNQLREKALIYENGLDDRTIECLKLIAESTARQQNPNLEIEEVLLYNYDSKLFFQFFGPEVENLNAAIERQNYDEIHKRVSKQFLDKNESLVVDREWACMAIQKIDSTQADGLYCDKCGQKLPEDSDFCQYCGSKLNKSKSCDRENISANLSKKCGGRCCAKDVILIVASIVAIIAVLFATNLQDIRRNQFENCNPTMLYILLIVAYVAYLLVRIFCCRSNAPYYVVLFIAIFSVALLFEGSVFSDNVDGEMYINAEWVAVFNAVWLLSVLTICLITIGELINGIRKWWYSGIGYREKCYAKIEKLKNYMENDIITQEQFERDKAELLKRINNDDV